MPELFYPASPAPVLPAPRASSPRNAAPPEEMFPVVEESGLVTAQMRRSYAHGGSHLLHPVVHLHIINRYGEIYLQRRSPDKDFLPGLWDTAVGGHVIYGEQPLEALYREAAEELGLYDFNPYFLDSYVYESRTEREFAYVWAIVGNYDLHPDNAEVAEGRYWNETDLLQAFAAGKVTPMFESEYRRFSPAIQALL